VAERARILLTFLGWADGLSGGDRHLLEMGARWSNDATVSVLAPPQAFPLVRSFLGEEAVLHGLGSASGRVAAKGPLLAAEYVRRAAVVSRRLPAGYDVVCGASHFAADGAAIAAGARRGALGVGYVYHLVEERERRDLRTRWSLLEERRGLALLKRHARLVFSSNANTRHRLEGRGIHSVHTNVGVDVASFSPGDASQREDRALFVGRLVESKGVVDAVEAWAEVVRVRPDARLVVAGIGPEQERARARSRQLGIEGAVEWRGFVSEQEKRDLMSESRVFLAPSYEEGWGISVCEALASGVPVVAYRLPTLDELFGGGYVPVALGDCHGLAAATLALLGDDVHARELSQRGRSTAERYDLGKVATDEFGEIARLLEA
jgi:glycosyltransferase involved in cell wall biosynthesis